MTQTHSRSSSGPFAVASAAVAILLLLAGCTGGGGKADASKDAGPLPTSSGDAVDGGTMVVTVTTSEIAPVDAALVQLKDTGFAAYTDAQGQTRFTNLEPGTYTAVASKAGYQSVQAEGRSVAVMQGEAVDVRLQLDPLPAGPADTFHLTYPQAGFISCAFEAREVGAQNCGRGAYVSQTHVGDPSDKTIHHWMVESEFIRGVLTEAKWVPNQEAIGKELSIENLIKETCNPDCVWYETLSAKAGPSPLRFVHVEGPEKSITKRLGGSPQHYPQKLHTNVRAACPPATCTAAVMLQQRYDMWTTVFYGSEPDPAFTMLPPG